MEGLSESLSPCSDAGHFLKLHCITNFFPNWKKDNSFQNDVIWCYFVLARCASVLTQRIEKDIAFGCCLIGRLPVSRLMWHSLNASAYMWSELQQEPLMTKWLGVSKRPTNRPVLSQRHCLVSSASSNHVWWCGQLHAGRLFWFQPVWHICCLSDCVVPVWELCSTGANALLILPSVLTNRVRALTKTGQHGTHGQQALWDTWICTCVAGDMNYHRSADVWRTGFGMLVLDVKRTLYLLINLVWNHGHQKVWILATLLAFVPSWYTVSEKKTNMISIPN